MPAENEGYRPRNLVSLILGLVLFLGILLAPAPSGMGPEAKKMAAVVALMASWWIGEATHIAVTALIPIAAFPLLGIMPSSEVAPHYANHLIYLYVGGFIIALAMEKWNLHRRVALTTIAAVGTRPERLVLGFMIATAFLSMWVSNTATTMMLLPVAIAVVKQISESASIDGSRDDQTEDRVRGSFGVILLLSVAYSASIGGVATIVGSPTNVALLGFAAERFPERPTITFLDWVLIGVPVVLLFLPVSWVYLTRFGTKISLSRIQFTASRSVIHEQLAMLGPMSRQEKIVLGAAATTALLWIFRQPIEVGVFTIPGWSGLFPFPDYLHDATVGILAGVLLFLIPVNFHGGVEWKGRRELFIMDWKTAERGMPWAIVILFGGGFALAAGMQQTGLAEWIGGLVTGLRGTPTWVLVPAACGIMLLLTEMTSNVATTLMMCPVLAEAGIELGLDPFLLLVPCTFMASFAFMLPVATPPNAVVFSSGWITIPAMARVGSIMNLIALAFAPALIYLLSSVVLGH